MDSIFGSFVVDKDDNGVWNTAAAFKSNEAFFRQRGIRSSTDLTSVLAMVPGASDLTTDQFTFTYGFSVNYLSRRVSGYVMRVSSKAHVKQFYYPRQRETLVCVVSKKNPTVTNKLELADRLYKVQSEMSREMDLWPSDEAQKDETRSETDRRLFYHLDDGRRGQTLYLYLKVGIPSSISESDDTVEKYIQQEKPVDWVARTYVKPAVDSFFDDEDVDIQYKVMTNKFEQGPKQGQKHFYFCNDTVLVDYSKDTMLIFDNHDKTLLMHRNMSTVRTVPSLPDMFSPPTRPLERNIDQTQFVALESAIANARLDTDESMKKPGYLVIDLVDHIPEMNIEDSDFHSTISYLEIRFDQHPKELTMKQIMPNGSVIMQGPVYWTQKHSNLPLIQKIQLSTRTKKEWVDLEPHWDAISAGVNPLGFALDALKKEKLPITEMKFTETGVKFPTAVLAKHIHEVEDQDL